MEGHWFNLWKWIWGKLPSAGAEVHYTLSSPSYDSLPPFVHSSFLLYHPTAHIHHSLSFSPFFDICRKGWGRYKCLSLVRSILSGGGLSVRWEWLWRPRAVRWLKAVQLYYSSCRDAYKQTTSSGIKESNGRRANKSNVLCFCFVFFYIFFLLFSLIEVHLRFNLLHWWFENSSRAAPWVQIHAFTVCPLYCFVSSCWCRLMEVFQTDPKLDMQCNTTYFQKQLVCDFVFSIILPDIVLVCLQLIQVKNSPDVFF